MSTVKDQNEPSTSRYLSTGLQAYQRKDYKAAEELIKQNLTVIEGMVNQRQTMRSDLLHILANVYRDCDRFGEAEKLYSEAEDLFSEWTDQTRQAQDVRPLNVLRDHALGLIMQSKFDQAFKVERQALSIAQRQARTHQFEVHKSLARLAVMAFLNGDYRQSEVYYKKCLEFREKTCSLTDRSLRPLFADLGIACYYNENYHDAERFFRQALQLTPPAEELADPECASLRNDLGLSLCAQGRQSEAQPLCKRSAQMRDCNKVCADASSELNELADVYCAHGHFEEARPLCEDALSARQFGADQWAHSLATYVRMIGRINCCDNTEVLQARLARLRAQSA